jgi:hypothetical protein
VDLALAQSETNPQHLMTAGWLGVHTHHPHEALGYLILKIVDEQRA